jgi:serine/threonine protein kinase
VNYPPFPYLLSDEIKRRQDEKVYFKEKELFYLLYALVAVKVDALERGETVGDIKPENVFINHEEKVKIGILPSFPYESTNFEKAKDPLGKSKNVVLAPEDLKLASQNQVDNSDNPKSEVFSIGATVLSAGILQETSDLYDYGHWTFST